MNASCQPKPFPPEPTWERQMAEKIVDSLYAQHLIIAGRHDRAFHGKALVEAIEKALTEGVQP